MIKFNVIRYKNFLSTGNSYTKIPLNDSQTVLIVGENGSGKTTILDALCFSLFGKPFRKITKPRLVNSINKKNCVVEIEFETNNKQYKVIRGIKPNVFEIWCDGVCLNQDSATKDYQEHLEKFILRMNYKSFTQIVILGSASFTPFMQLTTSDRRAVIEDLLDINVFSVMNALVKSDASGNKAELMQLKTLLNAKKETKSILERTIVSLEKSQSKEKSALKEEIKDYELKKDHKKKVILDLEKEQRKIKSNPLFLSKPSEQHSSYTKLAGKLYEKKSALDKEISFFSKNDTCPTCTQSIENKFKVQKMSDINEKRQKLEEGISELEVKIQVQEEKMNKLSKLEKTLRKIDILKNEMISNISHYESEIAKLEEKIKDKDTNDSLEQSKTDLQEMKKVIDQCETNIKNLLDEKTYIENALVLLKDDGIKARIIKQYLPIINQKINAYLLQMGFFCNFHLDENFDETIKSRYRDDFSYQNFSEGEKARINLSILLAWRAVAKLKNSVSTNLLIFDEIFDSSLDVNGTDEFLKIMNNLIADTNVFVISHKQDQFIEKFGKLYRFKKKKNFSILEK